MNEPATPAPFSPAHQYPMTFGQIFDRTYRLMRDNLRLFLSIAAVPSAAIFLAFAAVIGLMLVVIGPQIADETVSPPGIPLVFWAILICVYLIFPVIYALYMPAASYAATQADLGVAVTFRDAYAVAWRRFGRFLWLIILGTLYMIVPVVVCVVVIGLGALLLHFAMGASFGGSAAFLLIPLGVLLYIAALVCSILILLRISLAYPACVVEGLPAWNSLKRSIQLTKGAKGRIFLVMLVVYALTYLVSLVCVAVFCFVGALVAFVAILADVAVGTPAFYILIGLAVLGYLLIMIASCLFSYAAFTTALAVLYHDQRLRKEVFLAGHSQAGEGQA
jgi:hypothetical protein